MTRAKRRWRLLTIVIAAPLAAATIAVSLSGNDDPRVSNTERYLFPDEYVGPVFVEVPDSSEVISLNLVWGGWAASWDIGPEDPRSYWFSKRDVELEGLNPAIVVTVEPGADITIGYGQLPRGSRSSPSNAWHLVDSAG